MSVPCACHAHHLRAPRSTLHAPRERRRPPNPTTRQSSSPRQIRDNLRSQNSLQEHLARVESAAIAEVEALKGEHERVKASLVDARESVVRLEAERGVAHDVGPSLGFGPCFVRLAELWSIM